MSYQPVYGFPCVSNPHDFSPDIECSSPAEIAAHKEACRTWGTKDHQPNRGCYSEYDAAGTLVKHVTRTSWGIGVNLLYCCDGDGCSEPLDDDRMTCHDCARDFCPHCWPRHEKGHDDGHEKR